MARRKLNRPKNPFGLPISFDPDIILLSIAAGLFLGFGNAAGTLFFNAILRKVNNETDILPEEIKNEVVKNDPPPSNIGRRRNPNFDQSPEVG